MKKQIKRGIAMIELIFALVIMGIVLLSAPMLIQQSIQGSNVALQQESIAAIASHTGILLTKHWDEENTNLAAGVSPILTINAPVAGISPFAFAGINFDNNISGRTTRISGQIFNASVALGQDGADFDDVDDYNNVPITLAVFNTENSQAGELGDYVDSSIRIDTTVTYADDRPTTPFNQPVINADNNIFNTQNLVAGTQSNIKFIQTRLTTTSTANELYKNITLNAFTCNIGTYALDGEQY